VPASSVIAVTENDMNPTYVSAFAALAGTVVGGLTSFGTTWVTQRAQLKNANHEAKRAKLETLYNDFIAEASRVFADALTHQTEDPTNMIPLYALVNRMRLISSSEVIDAAVRIERQILETYLGPNRTLHEMRDLARCGGINILIEFSEACREDLAAPLRQPSGGRSRSL
jgi:hypothetical protein